MNYYKEFTKAKVMLEQSDPMNPDVHVDGLGSYDLKTLKANIRRGLLELAESLNDDNPRVWRNAKSTLDGNVIQAKIDAVVWAHDDLQARQRKGGINSRGIDKE
jgi:hypothetical protein